MTSTDGLLSPGGFLQPTLPSPPSTVHSASTAPAILPQPRFTPLKPGGTKESGFIDYVDKKLLGVSRRYEKRYNADFESEPSPDIEGRGYESFPELATDIEGVIDIVWVSGTRRNASSAISSPDADAETSKATLQIPYLLTIALTACSCLPSFPFLPRATFQLLHKLDLAFSSLLEGINTETGEPLPGLQSGKGKLSTTEKVRLRGLVERTRIVVVEVAQKGGNGNDVGIALQTGDDLTTDDDDTMEDLQLDGNHGRWEMEVARVYEKTISAIGDGFGFA